MARKVGEESVALKEGEKAASYLNPLHANDESMAWQGSEKNGAAKKMRKLKLMAGPRHCPSKYATVQK